MYLLRELYFYLHILIFQSFLRYKYKTDYQNQKESFLVDSSLSLSQIHLYYHPIYSKYLLNTYVSSK